MAEQCQHLSAKERYRLLNMLWKFEDMFGNMLGTWNTTLVYLELKDGTKTVCSQPYPVPSVHAAMSKK